MIHIWYPKKIRLDIQEQKIYYLILLPFYNTICSNAENELKNKFYKGKYIEIKEMSGQTLSCPPPSITNKNQGSVWNNCYTCDEKNELQPILL
jgi:hypothetical protein